MDPFLDRFVSYAFEQHVESIFYIVFSSAGHLFDYDCPFIAYFEPFLQQVYIFFQWKGALLDIRIQEVHPTLSALLSVSQNRRLTSRPWILQRKLSQIFIEHFCNLIPVLCAIVLNDLDQLLVFLWYPRTFLYRILFLLLKPILALKVVSAGNEARNRDPILFWQRFWKFVFTFAIFLDGP